MQKTIREWYRRKITVYLHMANIRFLQALSKEMGVPVGRIIDQVLDSFLSPIDPDRKPSVKPIAIERFKKASFRIATRERSVHLEPRRRHKMKVL